MADREDTLLSQQESAEFLGLSLRTIVGYLTKGVLQGERVRTRGLRTTLKIRESELRRFQGEPDQKAAS